MGYYSVGSPWWNQAYARGLALERLHHGAEIDAIAALGSEVKTLTAKIDQGHVLPHSHPARADLAANEATLATKQAELAVLVAGLESDRAAAMAGIVDARAQLATLNETLRGKQAQLEGMTVLPAGHPARDGIEALQAEIAALVVTRDAIVIPPYGAP